MNTNNNLFAALLSVLIGLGWIFYLKNLGIDFEMGWIFLLFKILLIMIGYVLIFLLLQKSHENIINFDSFKLTQFFSFAGLLSILVSRLQLSMLSLQVASFVTNDYRLMQIYTGLFSFQLGVAIVVIFFLWLKIRSSFNKKQVFSMAIIVMFLGIMVIPSMFILSNFTRSFIK